MQHILSVGQMRASDAFAMDELGIPPTVLMEDAALAASAQIRRLWAARNLVYPNVTIFCGAGNNGGDGFAIARHLCREASMRIVWIGSAEKMSAETLMNVRAVERHAALMGFSCIHCTNEKELAALDWGGLHGIAASDCIIDALVGVGGSEQPRGLVAIVLEKLTEIQTLNIAIDIPTGLHADTGIAHEHCFRADATITMAALKTGLLLHDGPDVCGAVSVVDIGIPERVIASQTSVCALEKADVGRFFRERPRRSSKHDYGKVLIIGGSAGMLGAPTLAANACLQAGAGLVRVCSVGIHAALRPEIMVECVAATADGTIAETAFDELWKAVEWSSVVAFGPGLGANSETLALGERLLMKLLSERPTTPVIIDADGLCCLAPDDTLTPNVVLTPHHGEFARLTGLMRDEVQERAAELAPEWAQTLGCVMLLKNVPTIISNGERSYWNRTGNAGMATAGSGDVLAGIIAGFCAQMIPTGISLLETVAASAFLHGVAGDIAAESLPLQSLCATDIIETLPKAIAEVIAASMQSVLP
jgi:NAD(P)H-hydrate epimerase